VTIDEAAAALHMSRATLYRQLKRLGLHTVTFPHAIGGTRAFLARGDFAQVALQRASPMPERAEPGSAENSAVIDLDITPIV
jgi:hypothetical protein